MNIFRINLGTLVLNFDGTPAQFNNQPLNLRGVLLGALTGLLEVDKDDPVEVKLARIALAERVQRETQLELSLGDVLMLVPLIRRSYTHPLVLACFVRVTESSVGSLAPLPVATSADSGNASAAESPPDTN
jgi:hypothetical protein